MKISTPFNFLLLGMFAFNMAVWGAVFYAGMVYQSLRPLPVDQRQRIAVEYLCGGHWKGMQLFCGQQVMDSSGRTK